MTNILDRDVPETDDELDAVLDRANSDAVTGDEPISEAPDGDEADEADHEAPKIKLTLTRRGPVSTRRGNQAWLDNETLANFNALMAAFKEAGYTRPEINEMTGFTPAAVWRAERGRVHADELDIWLELFRLHGEGKLPASAASLRPPKPAELKARISALEDRLNWVAEVLSNEDAKTVKQLRELVEQAREIAAV